MNIGWRREVKRNANASFYGRIAATRWGELPLTNCRNRSVIEGLSR
jgi:hypothetical protein